jgi:hypothetical protein
MIGDSAGHGDEGVGVMRIKLPTALATATVLSVGLLAGPAAAQEGFPPGGCEASLAGGTVEVANEDGTPFTDEEIEFLLEESGLTIEEICTIYGVEVADVVLTPPARPPAPPAPPVTPAAPAAPAAMPTEVLGEQLSRTGTDIALMVAAGLGILGLGFLALRRTRGTTEG